MLHIVLYFTLVLTSILVQFKSKKCAKFWMYPSEQPKNTVQHAHERTHTLQTVLERYIRANSFIVAIRFVLIQCASTTMQVASTEVSECGIQSTCKKTSHRNSLSHTSPTSSNIATEKVESSLIRRVWHKEPYRALFNTHLQRYITMPNAKTKRAGAFSGYQNLKPEIGGGQV